MIRFFSFFLILVLILVSCKEEVEKPRPRSQSRVVDLLIFLKEKKIEIWEEDTLLFSKANAVDIDRLPIGFFNPEKYDSNQLEIQFPDAFRQRKALIDKSIFQEKYNQEIKFNTAIHWDSLAWDLKQVVILPNEIDKNKVLEASYPSPHWLSELYAQLEIFILEKNKSN